MKKILLLSGFVMVSLLTSYGLGKAQAAQPQPVEIVTSGFAVKFLPERAWTISRIGYQNDVIGVEKGFYGATVSPEPGKFIGTGHDDGGVEEITSIEITVDGEIQDRAALQATIDCQRAKVLKHSKIGTLSHLADIEIQADRIDFTYRLKENEGRFYELIYPMMMCWTSETTEWLAGLKGGEVRSGEFSSDDRWQLEADAQWTAVYSPSTRIAAVMIFADDFPMGKLHKHGLWDREVYHKQYFQALFKEELAAEQTIECRATLIPVKAEPEQWKEAVTAAVNQFRKTAAQ